MSHLLPSYSNDIQTGKERVMFYEYDPYLDTDVSEKIYVKVLVLSQSYSPSGEILCNITVSTTDLMPGLPKNFPEKDKYGPITILRENSIDKKLDNFITEPIIKVLPHPGTTFIKDCCFMCNAYLKEIYLDANITELGDCAFYNCMNLETIHLPKSLIKIGTRAFFACVKLKHIVLNDGLLEICHQAFEYCKELLHISIPNSVENIAVGAFSLCHKLKSINLPKNLKKINLHILHLCVDLEELVIPESVIEIHPNSLELCFKLNEDNLKLPNHLIHLKHELLNPPKYPRAPVDYDDDDWSILD